jgi:hypothetical protein
VKADPWWPIEYGNEEGVSFLPHKRIALPSGIEVFAGMAPGGKPLIYVMGRPGMAFGAHRCVFHCEDRLEQRAKLLALAYPEG